MHSLLHWFTHTISTTYSVSVTHLFDLLLSHRHFFLLTCSYDYSLTTFLSLILSEMYSLSLTHSFINFLFNLFSFFLSHSTNLTQLLLYLFHSVLSFLLTNFLFFTNVLTVTLYHSCLLTDSFSITHSFILSVPNLFLLNRSYFLSYLLTKSLLLIHTISLRNCLFFFLSLTHIHTHTLMSILSYSIFLTPTNWLSVTYSLLFFHPLIYNIHQNIHIVTYSYSLFGFMLCHVIQRMKLSQIILAD